MAFIPVPSTVEAVFEFKVAGQDMKNILHYQTELSLDLALIETLGTALIDAMLGSDWFTNVLSHQTVFEDLKLTDISTVDGPSEVMVDGTSESLPQPGGGAGDATPNNVALVVTHRTNNRGRSFRGRTYLGGFAQSANANSVEITPTGVTDALGLFTDLDDAAVAHDFTPVVVSRHHNKAPRTTGVATVIQSHAVNSALDSQRRRLEGRGS